MENNQESAWLKERKKGIGGSDIAAILGLDKYKSALDVYFDKISNEITNKSDNVYTRAGKRLEDFVAKWFAESTNLPVRIAEQSNYTDPDKEYFKASVDRLINDDTVVEIKTTRQKVDDDLLTKWSAQLQWYLGVLNKKQGCLVYCELPFNFDYERFDNHVWSDSELEALKCVFKINWEIQDKNNDWINILRNEAETFWNENVLVQNPPQPKSAYESLMLYPQSQKGKILNANDSVFQAYSDLIEKEKQFTDLEDSIESLKNSIKIYMQDAEQLTYRDKIIATFKNTVSKRFNADLFKKEHSQLYQSFLKESSSRRFLLKT